MAKSTCALLAGAASTCALAFGLGPALANDSVIKGGQDANEWAVYGKDYANTRFSPLKSINTDNVSHLSLAYAFQLGSLRSNEATPLVIGDADVRLGEIGGAPFYIGATQYEAWKHTDLIIDVVPGRGGMFSLDNGRERRFLTRSTICPALSVDERSGHR